MEELTKGMDINESTTKHSIVHKEFQRLQVYLGVTEEWIPLRISSPGLTTCQELSSGHGLAGNDWRLSGDT